MLIRLSLFFLKDFLLMQQLDFEDEISWAAVCQTTNQLKSDWAQSNYLETLRIRKVRIVDLETLSSQPTLRGMGAKVAMAQLKEEIYGLQE